MERLTNQKQIILDYLRSTKSHPTAEDVFLKVRKRLPHISLGTVYRNLNQFVRKNTIRELSGETKRFDADISLHHHFVCKKCHRVIDLSDIVISKKYLKEKFKEIGEVTDYELFVYGVCEECKKN
ncbi:MAG: transcriptional repressor [Candidatus Moranbacteria bacterium]|nr:transcriptional repressor [Candidatus Moranbacteria bacterium]NCA94349.1 transcriptional repressor [Sphingobacteriia bacterium]NLC30881.1 transcriptional repressor [Candidatus Moranbacteria bacterium]